MFSVEHCPRIKILFCYIIIVIFIIVEINCEIVHESHRFVFICTVQRVSKKNRLQKNFTNVNKHFALYERESYVGIVWIKRDILTISLAIADVM